VLSLFYYEIKNDEGIMSLRQLIAAVMRSLWRFYLVL